MTAMILRRFRTLLETPKCHILLPHRISIDLRILSLLYILPIGSLLAPYCPTIGSLLALLFGVVVVVGVEVNVVVVVDGVV